MMMDGSDDAVDHRRPWHIYRKQWPSKCNGSCLNAGYIHPELWWYNTTHQCEFCYEKLRIMGLGHLVLGQSGVATNDWGKCPNCVCVGGGINLVNVWLLKITVWSMKVIPCVMLLLSPLRWSLTPAMLVFELNNWGKDFRLYHMPITGATQFFS